MVDKALCTANANLLKLFPTKHRNITLEEVEQVYNRGVLSVSADAKTVKGETQGYLTGILYLAPAKLSGFNMCPGASTGCERACLFSSGRGAFYSTTRSRVVKTLAFLLDRNRFNQAIKKSIDRLIVKAKNSRLTPAVRLNGTSDVLWERVSDIIQSYPTIQFYDYTKIASRMFTQLPTNYHLTFSGSESNDKAIVKVLNSNYNVAVVFKSNIPKEYLGFEVVNGDSNDLRFKDRPGVVVRLLAKGRAKKDASGFVKEVLK